MTTTITLSPTQKQMVEQKVRSGAYTSETEVISDSLQLLEERDRYLRDKALAGLNSGPSIPAEDVFHELREKANRLRSQQAT
ncbi:MAG: type II toxin-antitoxin system ParD family antitoxin [Patescibacteria group bacterium]